MNPLWILIGLAVVVGTAFLVVSLRDPASRSSGNLPAAGQATMADVERFARSGQKIMAIRCYREIHRCGLAEAKKAVDVLCWPG